MRSYNYIYVNIHHQVHLRTSLPRHWFLMPLKLLVLSACLLEVLIFQIVKAFYTLLLKIMIQIGCHWVLELQQTPYYWILQRIQSQVKHLAWILFMKSNTMISLPQQFWRIILSLFSFGTVRILLPKHIGYPKQHHQLYFQFLTIKMQLYQVVTFFKI